MSKLFVFIAWKIKKQIFIGSTKLLVGVGLGASGYLNSIEIIDLEFPSTSCQDLPNFPMAVYGSIGGLTSNKNPIICGGFNKSIYLSDCSTYEDGVWNKSMSMTIARYIAAASQSPYPNRQQSLFLSGGYDPKIGYLNTIEVLSDQGWQELPFPLPVTTYHHCMVLFQLNNCFGYQRSRK